MMGDDRRTASGFYQLLVVVAVSGRERFPNTAASAQTASVLGADYKVALQRPTVSRCSRRLEGTDWR